MKRFTFKALVATALLGLTTAAYAAFPEKPIKLVVPFPPGGTTDVVARIMVPKLQEILGQPIVIENRGGAGGSIATALVAKSPADGYTLLMATNSHTANPFIYNNLPFDTAKDFVSVSFIGDSPGLFLVHPSVPANTLKEFVDFAKKSNPPLAFGTAGLGTWPHLATELFKAQAGIDMVHVPYKGAGPALTDLLAGAYHFKAEGAATGYVHVKAGTLKALGITSKERMAQMPDIPTVAEQGYPEYETNFWMAIVAPAGTPQEVVAKLEDAFVKVVKDDEVTKIMEARNVRPMGRPAKALDELIAHELNTWPELLKAAGVTGN